MKSNPRAMALLLVVCIMMMLSGAYAQQTQDALLERQIQETEFGYVAYPALKHYPDELMQVTVNLLILERGDVDEHLSTLMKQNASGWGMKADYRGALNQDILSIAFSVYGDLGGNATEQAYEVLNYDLQNAREITLEDIFSDIEAAKDAMEQIMLDTVAPNLSGYVVNEEVTPLPMHKFSIDKDKITFYYEADQLMMLSGYAGSASFFYYEIAPFLKLDQGCILSRLGVDEYFEVKADSKEKIEQTVQNGSLPGIGARLEQALAEIFNEYRLFCDPDYMPSGRFFQLEAGQMRGIWMLADSLKRDYAETPLNGIRATRLNLYGLIVGKTTRETWLDVLGQPETTVNLDAYTAQDYYLPAGMSDYYTMGENRLKLHADEEGILYSIELTK